MPCNCDYLESQNDEIEFSRIYCLLKEIETNKHVDINSGEWGGYHKKVYNKILSKDTKNGLVSQLCSEIGKLSNIELSNHSLELQTWWRNHKTADINRLEKEKAKKKKDLLAQKVVDMLLESGVDKSEIMDLCFSYIAPKL